MAPPGSTLYGAKSRTPASYSTLSSMKNRPVHSRAGRFKMTCAASATISGLRERRIIAAPPSANSTAAVAMVVRGQSALQAMPAARYSCASPSMHSDMPYLDSE